MGESQSLDDLFRVAASAIDAGNIAELDRLIAAHPTLVRDRLDAPGPWLRGKVGNALDNFFQRPYLLWFVAEDPVRNGVLPPDIALVTHAIINAARRAGAEHLQEQLNYALQLVSWSWIARQCGVQIALIDLLIDAGASADGNPDNALVNSNFAAAAHLVCQRCAPDAVNGPLSRALERCEPACEDGHGLYSHASALHHGVSSGSLEAVRVLVDAGANLRARDTEYRGTPRDWAEHSAGNPQHDDIAAYLRKCGG
jgi:hypothetical protein